MNKDGLNIHSLCSPCHLTAAKQLYSYIPRIVRNKNYPLRVIVKDVTSRNLIAKLCKVKETNMCLSAGSYTLFTGYYVVYTIFQRELEPSHVSSEKR